MIINNIFYKTYFSLGMATFKSFLEIMLDDKNLLRKLIAFISIIIFIPILLIINPMFSFLWESVFQQEGFTAGYHVTAKKRL